MRKPIEDETWFLAHEIDYPRDNEKEHEQALELERRRLFELQLTPKKKCSLLP